MHEPPSDPMEISLSARFRRVSGSLCRLFLFFSPPYSANFWRVVRILPVRFHDVKNRAVFFFFFLLFLFYPLFHPHFGKHTKFSINGSNLLKVNGFLVSIYERIGWFVDSFSSRSLRDIYNDWKERQKKEKRKRGCRKRIFFKLETAFDLWTIVSHDWISLLVSF